MVTVLAILLGLGSVQPGANGPEATRLAPVLAEIASSDLNLRKGRGTCVSTSLADPTPDELGGLTTSHSANMPSPERSRFLREVKRLGSRRPLGKGLDERARADALRAAFTGAMPAEVQSCSSLVRLSMPLLARGKVYFVGRLHDTCFSSSFRGSLRKSKSGWKMEYSEYFYSMPGPPGCYANNPAPITSINGAFFVGEK